MNFVALNALRSIGSNRIQGENMFIIESQNFKGIRVFLSNDKRMWGLYIILRPSSSEKELVLKNLRYLSQNPFVNSDIFKQYFSNEKTLFLGQFEPKLRVPLFKSLILDIPKGDNQINSNSFISLFSTISPFIVDVRMWGENW